MDSRFTLIAKRKKNTNNTITVTIIRSSACQMCFCGKSNPNAKDMQQWLNVFAVFRDYEDDKGEGRS